MNSADGDPRETQEKGREGPPNSEDRRRDSSNDSPDGAEQRIRFRWLAFTSLGLEMGLSVAVFMFLGHHLDRRWSTEPWLLLTGALIGMIAAGTLMVRSVTKL